MSEPFMGEIKLVSFNFPPKGWALCNGQLLPIMQNQALFSLFGTMYGGNGQTNFALPNLRGRVPIHMGNGFTQGQAAGSTAHTLNISEIPVHTHAANISSAPTGTSPAGMLPATGGQALFAPTSKGNLAGGGSAVVQNVGGSQPHTNMQPYLVLNFIVALQGIFPSNW
ncbi:MAG TPA: tail fiber protein [Aggregatilineales bacterium]|jgi:microcystin-dependent protein|nr:tail fiber protein [Aggregatilineales bacterium]